MKLGNTETNNTKRSVFSLYASFFMIGITLTVYGPTINNLIDAYNITMAQASLFVTFMAMGRMLSVLASGMMADHFGRKPILIAGTSFLAIGLIGIGSLSWYVGGLLFAVIAGIGHGMVDTAGHAAMSDLYPDRVSGALNKMNMFFGIGCLVGPLISGSILSAGYSWRYVYHVQALIGAVIVLYVSLQEFPKYTDPLEPNHEKGKFFLSGGILMLSLVMFIYSGVGHSINTWINKYMGDVIKFSIFFAAGSLAVYNLGLTLGRWATSIVAEKIGNFRLILYSSIGSLCSILLALYSSNGLFIVIGLGLTGFFFGGLFPTTVAIGTTMYPDRAGTVTGILVTIAALGSMSIPAMVGFISQGKGLEDTIKSLVILVAILVVVAFVLYNMRYKLKKNSNIEQ